MFALSLGHSRGTICYQGSLGGCFNSSPPLAITFAAHLDPPADACRVCAVLAWLYDFFRDVVEEIPAAVGEGGLKKGQRYLSHRRVLPELKGLAGPQGTVVTWRREMSAVACSNTSGKTPACQTETLTSLMIIKDSHQLSHTFYTDTFQH